MSARANCWPTLEAPELVAQRAEAQSKLQGAEAQLAAVRAKAEADASTYEKLKAASATPGVVAGNDVVLAQKTVEADQSQIAAAQQNVEAARQAFESMTRHGRVSAGHRAVRRRRHRAQRSSGRAGRPGSGAGAGNAARCASFDNRQVAPRRSRFPRRIRPA